MPSHVPYTLYRYQDSEAKHEFLSSELMSAEADKLIVTTQCKQHHDKQAQNTLGRIW